MTDTPHEAPHGLPHDEPRHVPAPENEPPKEAASLASNMLAIVGLIILVILIIWGLVHLASLSKGFFSSLFSARTAPIELTAPSTVSSGTPFTVSWASRGAGAYTLVYQCKSGLSFKTDASGLQIPCGTSFGIASGANGISLVPLLSGSSAVQVPFTIIFTPSASSSKQSEGSVVITVTPAQRIAETGPQRPATPVQPVGPADLAVRILSVSADGLGTGIAVFDIQNVGLGASGSYYFEATLPTNSYGQTYYGAPAQNNYKYASPAQVSLAPGEHVQSTLRFTGAQQSGVFSVTVDPGASVDDSNRTNNYAYQTLIGGYYQPQPYYTY